MWLTCVALMDFLNYTPKSDTLNNTVIGSVDTGRPLPGTEPVHGNFHIMEPRPVCPFLHARRQVDVEKAWRGLNQKH